MITDCCIENKLREEVFNEQQRTNPGWYPWLLSTLSCRCKLKCLSKFESLFSWFRRRLCHTYGILGVYPLMNTLLALNWPMFTDLAFAYLLKRSLDFLLLHALRLRISWFPHLINPLPCNKCKIVMSHLNLATMKKAVREMFVTFDFSMLLSHESKGNVPRESHAKNTFL